MLSRKYSLPLLVLLTLVGLSTAATEAQARLFGRCRGCQSIPAPKPIDEVAKPAQGSQLTFTEYQDRRSEWRWRLVHKNGNIMADSGEGYKNRQDCDAAIERLRKDTATAGWHREGVVVPGTVVPAHK